MVIDGGELEVRVDEADAGAEHRPPLVFLHEGLGSIAQWRSFPDDVRRNVGGPATVVYSRHGYGSSAVVEHARTPDYMHDEADVVLPELLVELGIERPLLVGHSDGASIALLFAGAGRPVAGLVLLAPHVFVEDRSIAGIEAARVAFAETDLAERLARYHRSAESTFRGWNDVWLSPEFRSWNIEERLPSIGCPVLLVQGADDQYGSLAQLDAIERGVAGPCRRVVLPGVGHSPHLEAPDGNPRRRRRLHPHPPGPTEWTAGSRDAVTPSTYDAIVTTYDVPTSLSPSRVEAFTSCPMLFRFVSIEKIDDPPSIHTTRGSLVHRALELAFSHPAADRTPEVFAGAVDTAIAEYRRLPDLIRLGLDDERTEGLFAECRRLVDNYLRMENPRDVQAIGLELSLGAKIDGLTLRGIIDRLDLRDGELVVTDYKTGRSPSTNWELRSLSGVRFYALLCQQVFGRLPAAVRLLYLGSGEIIEATPSEQATKFVAARTAAVWKAVERACLTGDFKPHPTALCELCAFRPWCPAFGGDSERAVVEAPLAFGLTPA